MKKIPLVLRKEGEVWIAESKGFVATGSSLESACDALFATMFDVISQ